jgi:poly(rC)-binding protein 2/3/4
MSTSPPTTSTPSQKRPLEEPSSPSRPTDQPEAKRPALDKISKDSQGGNESAVSDLNGAALLPSGDDVVKAEPAEESSAENGAQEDTADAAVPDAPTDTADGGDDKTSAADVQPIQSTTAGAERGSGSSAHTQHQDESTWIHIRAVISSAEAATVIGKGGENVTQIRRLSGAKCTVSDYSRGAVERILTVSGLVDATAKVCSLGSL